MRFEVIILGVDPGTIVTGYGIIHVAGNVFQPIDYGCIRPPVKLDLPDRYVIIYDSIINLIDKFKPQVLVVEMQYVSKNVQSAIKLGMARGVILLAAKQKGLEIREYYPTEAKLAVVGTGKASKTQVQAMIQRLLNLAKLPTPEDASDALALAICHAQRRDRKLRH